MIESEFEWDEVSQAWVIKRTDDWVVAVMPMIFNHRILLSGAQEYGRTYTAGWCYNTALAAMMAAKVFDPETDMDPLGFKKLACDARRTYAERVRINDAIGASTG